MKAKTIWCVLVAAVLLALPAPTFAQCSVPQGCTGLSSIPAGAYPVGNSQLRLTSTTSPTVGYITATSGTSSFPKAKISIAVELLGEYITNLTTWFTGKADTWLATKSTSNLTEGSNLYYTLARDIPFSTSSADYYKSQNNFYSTSSTAYDLSTYSKGYFFSTTSVVYWDSTQSRWATTSADYHLSTKDKGYFFSTTSADAWLNTKSLSAFSTTSADYWKTQNNFYSTTSANFWSNVGLGFSTTSSDYWLSTKSISAFSTTSATYFSSVGLAFSTTSAAYFLSQNQTAAFSTSSANFYAQASTTLVKTYSNNTFTGTNTFANISATGATTTSLSTGIASSSLLVISNIPTCTGSNGLQTSSGGIVACGTITSTFSTSSASYFASVGLAFSTTSDAYFLSQNQGAAFSTTSANYWKSQLNFFSTTSADFWKTQNNFFSTTSASHFSSLGLAFSTTSSAYYESTLAPRGASTTFFTDKNTFGVHTIFSSLFATRASSTHATSTNLDVTGLLTFNGVTGSSWASFCTTITGGSGLCDGVDDTAAGVFATSSADYWKTQRNFFSTSSADYWETQQTARTADDLTNNSIEDLNDVASMTENYGDVLGWNGSTWTDMATTSLFNIATGGTNGILSSTDWTSFNSRLSTSSLGLFDKGYFFSTTSADYLQTQRNYFSTTSADYLQTQRNYYSTTSANFFTSVGLAFSTTSENHYFHSSSTVPTTYKSNIFTGTNSFQKLTATDATTTSFSTGIASTSDLWISLIRNGLLATNGAGRVVATTSPTALSFTATGNTASVLPYASSTAITVSGSFYGAGLTNCSGGNVLTWTNGTFGCAADATGGGGGVWPFTTTDTNFGVAVQSTTTPEWLKNGVHASSTSQFLNLNVYGRLSIGTTTPFGAFQVASSGPQLVLTDTNNLSTHWNFRNIDGDMWFATSTGATSATSTWSDPNVGFIKFPKGGGCVGCTDIVLPGGINLLNSKYVSATSSSPAANTFQDIYTAPTGRRAFVRSTGFVNPVPAVTIGYTVWVKNAGSYYKISIGTTSVNSLALGGVNIGYVLDPGQSVAIFQDNANGNASFSIIEFDSTTPFYSPHVFGPTGRATTTLYTVPTNSNAFVMNAASALNLALASTVIFDLNTVASVTGNKVFSVKSGQTGAIDSVNSANSLSGVNVSAGGSALNFMSNGIAAGSALNSGDAIAFWIATTSGVSTAAIWTTVIEH